MEGDGASQASAVALFQRIAALREHRQAIRAELEAVLEAKDTASRLSAAQRLLALQWQFNELAAQAEEGAAAARRLNLAGAHATAYDTQAARQAVQCFRLEQQAEGLDAYVGRRAYTRLHPRYALSSC